MLEHKEIGQRIGLRRKALAKTLAEVAVEVGVATSTIQRYEKGQFDKIKMPVVEAIADALHVSPAWIVSETTDPTNYEDGDLLASIPLSYMALFNGDAQKAVQYISAVDGEVRDKKTPTVSDEELLENVIIFSRDGKIVRKQYSKETMETVAKMLEAIPDVTDDRL